MEGCKLAVGEGADRHAARHPQAARQLARAPHRLGQGYSGDADAAPGLSAAQSRPQAARLAGFPGSEGEAQVAGLSD